MATVKPVKDWTLEDAKAQAKADLPRDYEAARRMVEDGDHWLDGDGWTGHRTGDRVTDAAIRANIEPQFIPDDVVGELVENRTNGLLGQEADVALIPLEEVPEGDAAQAQQEEIDRLLALLSTWWDRKQFWVRVGEAASRVSFAGRGTLRTYVASGNLVNGGLPTDRQAADALALVEIEAPRSDAAVRYLEPTTQRSVAVYVGKVDDQDQAEVWQVNPQTTKTELTLLGGPASARRDTATMSLDLGGRLPIAEARGSRIITPSVRRLQGLLNFITTVTGRTVETAGFRERYFINAEPPGIWLPTPPVNSPPLAVDTTTVPGTTYYKHRAPWMVGASMTNEVVGLRSNAVTASGENREEFLTPSVQALDPVDPAFTTAPAETITLRLYRRGRQGHLGLAKTGEASGTAYQQARAQFEADLKRLKNPIEGMIRDALEAVLATAGIMAAELRGVLARYRIQVTLHLSAGPVTAEDARLAVELRNARAISQQTMLARVGNEDPVAEQEAIDADPLTRAEFWNKMAAAFTTITGISGMTAEGAGYLLGLTPEQLEVLRTGRPPAPTAAATPAPALAA